MGAIDPVYCFFCCMSLGEDAAKNGSNTSDNTNCKATGSQDRVTATTASSSSQSCWVGICQRNEISVLSETLKENPRKCNRNN